MNVFIIILLQDFVACKFDIFLDHLILSIPIFVEQNMSNLELLILEPSAYSFCDTSNTKWIRYFDHFESNYNTNTTTKQIRNE